jgi:hypothetical protein
VERRALRLEVANQKQMAKAHQDCGHQVRLSSNRQGLPRSEKCLPLRVCVCVCVYVCVCVCVLACVCVGTTREV